MDDAGVGNACDAGRRCQSGDVEVCGEDGKTYMCEALAMCEGVGVDDSGKACGTVTCEPIPCNLFCGDDGFKKDAQGCDICECNTVSMCPKPPSCNAATVLKCEGVDINMCAKCSCQPDGPVCSDAPDATCMEDQTEECVINSDGCKTCRCVDISSNGCDTNEDCSVEQVCEARVVGDEQRECKKPPRCDPFGDFCEGSLFEVECRQASRNDCCNDENFLECDDEVLKECPYLCLPLRGF